MFQLTTELFRACIRQAAVLVFALFWMSLGLSVAAAGELPKVYVMATGGTIAGEQQEPGTLGGYEIRKTVNEVIALVPEVKKYAQVEAEQFINLASPNISPDHWLRLARRINALFAERPDISGIVLTHGTSRLEETAFFLHLTVRSDKPVVLVGAQRPPTGISPDGPINLLAGVRVAASSAARGKGVVIVMDERILSARDAQKAFARSGGFGGSEMGVLGIVATQSVEFFYTPTRKHTVNSDFDIKNISTLPRVDIQYSYAGSEGAVPKDARGIIVATTGLTPGERIQYDALLKKGVIVATTFPSGENVGSPSDEQAAFPVVAVQHMLPLHARILLMLALTKTQDAREIQRIFDQY